MIIAARLRQALSRAGRWLGCQAGVVVDRDAVVVLNLLRRYRPILTIRTTTVVLRYDDVLEVTSCPESFTVDPYGAKIANFAGPFALGIDEPKAYGTARAVVDHAFLAGDVERLAARSAELAAECVSRALPTGQIDVVGQLADPVLARVVTEHLGIPSPDQEAFVEWTRRIFAEIFLDQVDEPAVREHAAAATRSMHAMIDGAIGHGVDGQDSVLNRLLHAAAEDPALTREIITGNLVGLGAAWIPNSSKSLALALDELLRRPEAMAIAQAAARADDDDRVGACLFEALRLRPQNAGLLRRCIRDHEVASGTPRAHTIRTGAMVLAMTKSAMRDELVVEDPEVFRLDRPDTDYLHFGYGRHACLGQAMSRTQLPAMAKPLLRLDGFMRAPGRSGRLAWDQFFPTGLDVRIGS